VSVDKFALGLLAALLAAVACGKTGNDSPNATDGATGAVGGQGDANIGDGASSTVPDAGADWDAYGGEVPDAFPDDCATALPVVAEEYATVHDTRCQLSPGNVACESTNDCIVNFLPQCCGSSLAVGVNRDASLVCAPPNGCLPPPGSGPCAPSVATEDCQEVAASHYVGVACVNNQCLTYAIGP